jgi:hypothetical protein
MNSIDYIKLVEERIKIQSDLINLENTLKKLTDGKKLLNEEKLNFLEEKKNLLVENDALIQELNDMENIFKICKICHQRPKISLNCCRGGICMECWRNIEITNDNINHNFDIENVTISKCPYCRQPLPKLVDVLINIINKLQISEIDIN